MVSDAHGMHPDGGESRGVTAPKLQMVMAATQQRTSERQDRPTQLASTSWPPDGAAPGAGACHDRATPCRACAGGCRARSGGAAGGCGARSGAAASAGAAAGRRAMVLSCEDAAAATLRPCAGLQGMPMQRRLGSWHWAV